MSDCLVLSSVFEAAREILLVEDGGTMSVVFGWREPAKQINQGLGTANRVIFVPGNELRIGAYGAAKYPGRNPRPMGSLVEQFTVYVWAYDSTAPNDELVQYRAWRLLHDAVVRAVFLAGKRVGSQILLTDGQYIRPPNERIYGVEAKLIFTADTMIPDAPFPTGLAYGGEVHNFLQETPDGVDIYPGGNP